MMAIKILVFAGMVVQCTTVTCPMCPAGKYLKSSFPCQCSPCPNNTFTDKRNNASRCQQCTKVEDCPKSKIIGKKCTSIKDAVCECPKGQFFDMGVLFCIDCTICPVGQGTFIRCATESNTDCKPCVQGKTYSNSSRMGPCDTCSPCSGVDLYVKEPCNSTKNTICEKKLYYPPSSNTTPKINVITKKETLSTTKSKSHRPKTKSSTKALVVAISVVLVLLILGISIYCFRQRRHQGHERSIDDDVEEEMTLQENREEKSAQPYPQHSGLRGRHVRNPRRLEQNRRKLADPSASSEDHQLLNSGGLLREAPYQVVEQLALLLNPRSLNNWVRLAGKLEYSREKVDYFGMEPENATQRMLSDWMTSNAGTIRVLHRHLKSISRDDAAAVFEV